MVDKIKKLFKTEYFWAFVTAGLFALIGFALAGAWPFGEYSVSCSDMRLQFLDLLTGFTQRLKSGGSLFVAYEGLGTNLYAWATYMMFDPLNVIFLFFDGKYYQDVYLLLLIIKYAFIALGASVYLKRSSYTALGGIMNIALAVLYAFGGYCVKNAINFMWLGNVALLPVVLLGIERAADKKRADLLIVSYFMCLSGCYYLAYSVGIFAALYFVFYCTVKKHSLKDAVKGAAVCAFGAAFAAALCAVILLPAFKNISSGYSDMFAKQSLTNFWYWDVGRIARSFFTLQNTGASSAVIYGFYGFVTLYLPLLFICDNSVPLRERISVSAFIAFMVLSLAIRPLYLMWHIFREPTGFFGRFVFATGFLLVLVSARYISKYRPKKKIVLYIPVAAVAALTFYSNNIGDKWELANIAATLGFVGLYALIYAYTDRQAFKNAFAVLILSESLLIGAAGIYLLKTNDQWYSRDYRLKYINDTGLVMSGINDGGFYRMTDVSSTNTNLPLGIGYNSLETFSSQTNQRSLERLSRLGIWCPYDYRACANYFNNTVAEGLFGVKYVMATDSGKAVEAGNGKYIHTISDKTTALRLLSDNYKLIAQNEGGYLYENTRTFPLMFAAEETAINADKSFYKKEDTLAGSYRNQAIFLNALFGKDYKLYDEYEPEEMQPFNAQKVKEPQNDWEFFDMRLTNLPEGQTEADYDMSQIGFLGYNLTADKDGEYFIDARYVYDAADVVYQKVLYSVNGAPLLCLYTPESNILANDIGPFKAGDNINIQLQLKRSCTLQRPLILRLRQEEYDDFYNAAMQNSLLNIAENKGVITAQSDFDGDRLIFCSLSYDEGFHVYIDGKECEKVKIADAFLGFRVPQGSHDISIKYISPGFKTGAVISLLSLVFGIAAAVVRKLKKTQTD